MKTAATAKKTTPIYEECNIKSYLNNTEKETNVLVTNSKVENIILNLEKDVNHTIDSLYYYFRDHGDTEQLLKEFDCYYKQSITTFKANVLNNLDITKYEFDLIYQKELSSLCNKLEKICRVNRHDFENTYIFMTLFMPLNNMAKSMTSQNKKKWSFKQYVNSYTDFGIPFTVLYESPRGEQ